MLKNSEELHKALIALEKTIQSEKEERAQLEALVEALRVLNHSDSVEEIFEQLIDILTSVLQCESAIVMLSSDSGEYNVYAASRDEHLNIVWPKDMLLEQIEKVDCMTFSDIYAEKNLPFCISDDPNISVSAITIPFRAPSHRGLLVALHKGKDIFTDRHIQFAKRLTPLIEQALVRVAAITDISDQESRIRSIMSQMFDGILTLSQSGDITLANIAATKSFGLSEKDILKKNFIDLLSERNKYNWIELKEKFSNESSELDVGLELSGKKDDGTEFPIDLRLSLVMNEDQYFYLVVIRDMTEKRLLEQQLLQSQKLESLGTMAAGIAHEINTPIQYVRDNTMFLRDEFEKIASIISMFQEFTKYENSKKEEFAKQIEKASKNIELDYLLSEIPIAIKETLNGAEQVAYLVRAMKEFSHPGTKERELIDLNSIIQGTVAVTQNEWKYVADITTQLDPNLKHTLGFASDIKQVILNLIVNASQAIESQALGAIKEKGMIVLRTLNLADFVEIRISDTGGGIPEDIAARIFDPFFTTKAVGKGTGLGLAYVHNTIVDKHKGAVSFETKIGIGTTFIIRLPIS